MKYFALLNNRIWRNFATILGTVAFFAGLGVAAIWGENKSSQYFAWFLIATGCIIFFARLVFYAPYSIWKDDQKKIANLQDLVANPVNTRKEELRKAGAELMSSARSIYNEWKVSDKLGQDRLRNKYSETREKLSLLAEGFLTDDNIYRSAQDTMNRCDILVDDRINGTVGRNALQDAVDHTKRLLMALSCDNEN